MKRSRRAAHFLLIPELLYSPPNDAIINAYLENGFSVDIYSPGKLPGETMYGRRIRTYEVAYSWIWLIRNVFSLKWVKYELLSCTSEDPLAVIGILSILYLRKIFCLVDEIKAGSYRGDRSDRWKMLCKWSIRNSEFSIVNDIHRVDLLEEYSEMKIKKPIIVYPGCFTDIPSRSIDRKKMIREQWKFSMNDFVIGSSGGFNMTAGADWLLNAVKEDQYLHAVIQPLGVSPLSIFLLQSLSYSSRVFVQSERLSWREAWISAQALDIGLCIYTNQAPQFQKMGISSNRLCMFLAMGVPVIASYQQSFSFLEEYDCGVMVRSYNEFKKAVLEIKSRQRIMSQNCEKCLTEYIRVKERYEGLKQRISLIR